jgi:hypothetical protein
VAGMYRSQEQIKNQQQQSMEAVDDADDDEIY